MPESRIVGRLAMLQGEVMTLRCVITCRGVFHAAWRSVGIRLSMLAAMF